MAAELLHAASQQPDIGDALQALHQRPGAVVYAHPGDDLREEEEEKEETD